MRWSVAGRALTAVAILFCLVAAAAADVKLPGVFADHTVVQRDMPVPVWGWAVPGEKVTVTFAGQSKAATADQAGKWAVKLDALEAGGPHLLKIEGNNTVQFQDVLVGKVWLCSGQSNMDMRVYGVLDRDAEIAAAHYPQIRTFIVARKTAEAPQDNCGGQWQVCSPKTAGGFSAAAYFFGRELHRHWRECSFFGRSISRAGYMGIRNFARSPCAGRRIGARLERIRIGGNARRWR